METLCIGDGQHSPGLSRLKDKVQLSRREMGWIQFFEELSFELQHKPGSESVADALSRRPDMMAAAVEYSMQ